MNRNILIPRRTRRSKGKFSKLMLRIGHYRDYRKNGYTIRAAWFKSSLVIN